ncbi:peroxiredoxin [Paraburkholderia ginsengiterrae]|uniref:Peroxiredoxin n=1 Tax=Paraburkholderia ginsengiterrae TaxID=1462993 RepID=A0A1A9N8C6_9BURK|nr:OsmC family protein [Paraburkholderia ginsengiterrae]OAJ55360.1 peroxiredoxin [Paraburkholderia ginsengiterrae]OAJ61382.1 peroxiredoxin [Paraburkholderia ginsengiterrae]
MEKIEKVLASGTTHATINRDPNVEPGALDLKLSAPGVESLEFIATDLHPRAEQLFAGAWSACYTTVFGRVASLKKVTLPPDYSVDIQVSIGSSGAGYCLGAELTVRVPGLGTEVVEELAQLTHQHCPYSKSVHGNIEVITNIVTV